MASISEQAFALVLGEYLPTAQPMPIVDVLTNLVPNLRDEGEIRDDAEIAQAELRDFRARLVAHYNTCVGETGEYCPYEFNKVDDELLQGCAWIADDDPDDVRVQRTALAEQFHPLLQAIRALEPDDFELLGAGVLDVIGVEAPKATKRAQDEGIDFFGRLRMSEFLLQSHTLPNVERQLRVWIIGQAKRYTKYPVSTAEIRELIGSCELARAGIWPIQGAAYGQEMQIRPFDPIYALMITCGQISEPGRRILREAGVIGMDGPMLAQMLALEGVASDLNAGGAFSPDLFAEWIASQSRLT